MLEFTEEKDPIQKAMNEWTQQLRSGVEGLKKDVEKVEQNLDIMRAKKNVVEAVARRITEEKQRESFKEANAGKIDDEISTEESILEALKLNLRIKSNYATLIIDQINKK